ncbi:MAG: threonine--tRNA ligase [Candidatus Micrarchaeota archaeon]|nr:threonine--tRNA ligase [Candidatus Micrarchaeota archaeon]
MKILQLDVDSISYELIKPESKLYEESKEKGATISDALALLVSVEEGDTNDIAEKAAADSVEFASKNGRKTILVYPYAHLSDSLADPKTAMQVISHLYKSCEGKGIEVRKAPFGWNKSFSVSVKGHPLAEQGKSYGEGVQKKAVKRPKARVNTSIVRKSDWAGLPDADHRTIGEKLDLYSFQEVSPGMVYWHNNGYIIFKELFKYIRDKLDEYGYQEISTPALANLALWHVSGHIDHYRSEMFTFESGNDQMGLKPMNCPSTIMVFKSRKWSYRDLPLRLADFDKLYRNEVSGALTGLFRVREMTQDDAHLFVREDQVKDELVNLLKMIKELYEIFGLSYDAKVSTMPDSHLGDEALWREAESALKNALKENGMKFGVKEKDGAFYGPKIDFQVKDSMGREWQCATVQLDYQLPKRFGLTYTGEDGKEHEPVMIHRVIYGSLERFLGVLVEHLQGKFPTWLAPVQVQVVSISDQVSKYAEEVHSKLRAEKIRAGLDNSDRTLQYKIREAQLQQVPYILVIGKKEQEGGLVTVRERTGKQTMGIKLDEFMKSIKSEISDRRFELGLK